MQKDQNALPVNAVGKKRNALAAAFPKTIPIMTGFLFLGASYGILMKTSGFLSLLRKPIERGGDL